MIKKILLLLALCIASTAAAVGGKMYFSANILQTETETPQTSKMFINAIDAAANCDCNAINKDNIYLEEGTTETGKYNPDAAITLFLEDQDEAFSERFELFRGSQQCDLTKEENSSVLEDKRIEPVATFVTERWEEYQQIDCALQVMEQSPDIYCDAGLQTKFQAFQCDTTYRQEKIQDERVQLQLSMDIAMMHMDEMASMYSLHEKIVCVNEHIAEQRQQLVEFVEQFAKIPGTYINSTVNK